MNILLQKDIFMEASGHGFLSAEGCSSKLTFSRVRESSSPEVFSVVEGSGVRAAEKCSVKGGVGGLPPCVPVQDTPRTPKLCCQGRVAPRGSCNPSAVCKQIESLHLTETPVVTPSQLAIRIQTSPDSFVLLDCRSFIAYNMVHIVGALSLNCCDKLTRKRLQCGKLQLEDTISGLSGKEEYRKKKQNCDVVVYDEESSQLERPGPPSPLKLVVNLLKKERREVSYLQGGLSSFQKEFPLLCVKTEYTQQPILYSPTTPDVVNDQIDTAVITEVLPYLYIGNYRDAANLDCLKEHGITHVLNVTAHVPFHFEAEGFKYKRLPATDSGHQNLKQYFDDAFNFIEEAKNSGGKVLVHCQAGVSRSATITISYIMRSSKLRMLEAFKLVKSKRPIIAPNLNFMGQLYELEQHSREKQSAMGEDISCTRSTVSLP